MASLAPLLCRCRFPGLLTPFSLSVLCPALYLKTPHTQQKRGLARVGLRFPSAGGGVTEQAAGAKKPPSGGARWRRWPSVSGLDHPALLLPAQRQAAVADQVFQRYLGLQPAPRR
ncbi:hypothetical protein [Nitrosomonas sp. HPC101]|uniref:hypothetical protein n=1 Tax=Nitrosomonas sp. HPC101 TaxID=1658667 RepID=UPI0013716342|nr:hypothetical protein [Nitrosomonas sp. HPC101]